MDGLSPFFGSARQPVFDGLACAGVPARTIAEMVNVSAPTVSKWRSGKLQVPLPSLVFLTLILAHLVEDAEILERRFDEIGARDSQWDGALDEQLTTMRRLLHEQEVFTSTLAANEVLAGARLYRDWLHAGNTVNRSDARPPDTQPDIQTGKQARLGGTEAFGETPEDLRG